MANNALISLRTLRKDTVQVWMESWDARIREAENSISVLKNLQKELGNEIKTKVWETQSVNKNSEIQSVDLESVQISDEIADVKDSWWITW
jgi:hypothetical protein